MDKEEVVYIHNGILPSHKKEWSNAICSNMNGPRDYLTEWSKPDREGNISIWYHLCGIQKVDYTCIQKVDPSELMYKTEIDPQTQNANLWLPKGKGWDKLGVWDLQIHTTVYKIDKQQELTV